MKPSDLLPEHAIPAEILCNAKWLGPLIKGSSPARGSPVAAQQLEFISHIEIPRRPEETGLRTLVAVSSEHRDAAELLVRRRYAQRGYSLFPAEELDLVSPGIKAQGMTLLAEEGGKILGTVTIRSDSSQGLLAEESYGTEIESVRRQGCRIGEVTKLAVEEGADWKSVLNALMQSTYLVAHDVLTLTDLIIEVNPRHVGFYRRVFGFMVASAQSMCSRVGAPSVLLRLELDEFSRRLQLSQRSISKSRRVAPGAPVECRPQAFPVQRTNHEAFRGRLSSSSNTSLRHGMECVTST